MFLNRNINCGFCVSRGHWVHLTSDLRAPSGGVAFLLGKRGPLQVPHASSRVTFQWMHFPPWTIHITLFLWGGFLRMWATVWVGSCPILMAPDLGGMTQLFHSLQVKRKTEKASIWGKGLLLPVQQRNILIMITRQLYFHDSFYALAFTNCHWAFSWKYLYVKKLIATDTKH